MYERPELPCSVATSIKTRGAEGIVPTAVRTGRFSGANTARAFISRMVSLLVVIAASLDFLDRAQTPTLLKSTAGDAASVGRMRLYGNPGIRHLANLKPAPNPPN